MPSIIWMTAPEEHDYPAAAAYLALIAPPADVDAMIALLREASVQRWKAKDILRASALPLLPGGNPHVAADLYKISSGKPLSPALLVRGNVSPWSPLQVADGYHRVCASYHTDENADIPCRLVGYCDGGSQTTGA